MGQNRLTSTISGPDGSPQAKLEDRLRIASCIPIGLGPVHGFVRHGVFFVR